MHVLINELIDGCIHVCTHLRAMLLPSPWLRAHHRINLTSRAYDRHTYDALRFDFEFAQPGCGGTSSSYEYIFGMNLLLIALAILPILVVLPTLILLHAAIEHRRLGFSRWLP